MPYQLPPGANPHTTGVALQIDTPRQFHLLTPFWYAPDRPLPARLDALLPQPGQSPPDQEHRWIRIPEGASDLASVPGILVGLIASYGRHTLAALLHDYLSGLADHAPRTERFAVRSAADEVFYTALRDPTAGRYRAPAFRSLIFWTGVSAERYVKFDKLGALVGAGGCVGGWLAGLWLLQQLPGPRLPVAAWVLLAVGLIVLTIAGLFATRLGELRPPGIGADPANAVPSPTRLAAATSFMPSAGGTVGRASDSWVVRALAAASALLLLGAVWAGSPWPPLFGIGVPGIVAALGTLLLLGGSVFLLVRSPTRRDGFLPLILIVAAPGIGVVAGITVAVLYLLWLPDAFSEVGDGPINTVRAARRQRSAGGPPEGS